MITFDTNKAKLLTNLRTCDAIPLVATVTNMAHLVFKTASFFRGQEVESSLYSKFVTQGSTLEFIVRAIPVVGQIFSAAQHVYYKHKSTKELLTPPIHVMTNSLANSYVTAKINSGDKKVFAEASFRFVTPQKFETTVLNLLKENKWEELLSLIKNCDESSLMTLDLMKLICDEIRILEKDFVYQQSLFLANKQRACGYRTDKDPVSEIKKLFGIEGTFEEFDAGSRAIYMAIRDLG